MNKQYPVLNSLQIKRCNRWKTHLEDPVTYEGEIEFLGENGSITINLDDQVSRVLINVIGDQVVESSKTLAEKLTTEFITGDSLLTGPATEEVTDSVSPGDS